MPHRPQIQLRRHSAFRLNQSGMVTTRQTRWPTPQRAVPWLVPRSKALGQLYASSLPHCWQPIGASVRIYLLSIDSPKVEASVCNTC